MSKRRRIHLSKFARVMDSVQLKQVRAEALELCAIAEESAWKTDKATRQLSEFHASMPVISKGYGYHAKGYASKWSPLRQF